MIFIYHEKMYNFKKNVHCEIKFIRYEKYTIVCCFATNNLMIMVLYEYFWPELFSSTRCWTAYLRTLKASKMSLLDGGTSMFSSSSSMSACLRIHNRITDRFFRRCSSATSRYESTSIQSSYISTEKFQT